MMPSSNNTGPSLRNGRLCKQLADWFSSPLGIALIESERAAITKASKTLYGVRQLEVGIAPGITVCESGNCVHRFSSVGLWSEQISAGTVVCAPEELPLPNDGIDLAILHHTLDFASHPHQALREASRVLRGGGHLVVVGFNPLSLWGWRKMLARRPSGPWRGRFLSRKRIEDWLEVLDFVVEEKQLGFFQPPFQNPALLSRFSALERFGVGRVIPGGAFYVMVAEKRVGAKVRQRPVWRRKNVIAMPVAKHARETHYSKESSGQEL